MHPLDSELILFHVAILARKKKTVLNTVFKTLELVLELVVFKILQFSKDWDSVEYFGIVVTDSQNIESFRKVFHAMSGCEDKMFRDYRSTAPMIVASSTVPYSDSHLFQQKQLTIASIDLCIF